MAAVAIFDPGTHGLSGFSREQKYALNTPAISSTEFYQFRGRDSGAPGYPTSTPVYVTWTGNTVTAGYGGALPYGGPLVDSVARRVE